MDYEFRKKLYELDEIGFIGKPNAKESKKDEYLISAWIRVSKKIWHEQGRSLTEEEKNKVIQDAERAYNREVRQRRKTMTFNKVASVTL
jgi:DNA-directed RNA polymerase beta' subunit